MNKHEIRELEQRAVDERKKCATSSRRLLLALDRLKAKVEMEKHRNGSVLMPPRRA